MIDETEVKCPDCGSENVEIICHLPKEWECVSCGYTFDEDDLDEEE